MTFPNGQTILNWIAMGFFAALGAGLFGWLIISLNLVGKLGLATH